MWHVPNPNMVINLKGTQIPNENMYGYKLKSITETYTYRKWKENQQKNLPFGKKDNTRYYKARIVKRLKTIRQETFLAFGYRHWNFNLAQPGIVTVSPCESKASSDWFFSNQHHANRKCTSLKGSSHSKTMPNNAQVWFTRVQCQSTNGERGTETTC